MGMRYQKFSMTFTVFRTFISHDQQFTKKAHEVLRFDSRRKCTTPNNKRQGKMIQGMEVSTTNPGTAAYNT
jgi:hypothetical protein